MRSALISAVACLALFGAPLAALAQDPVGADVVQTSGVVAESATLRLVSDAPLDAAAVLSDLEALRLAVLADLGLDAAHAEPLTITLTDDLDLFEAITPGGITAGIYLQGAAGADIVVGYSEDAGHLLGGALEPGWLRLVLRHELIHHIIEAHYPRKLPIWLGEGLAEYYATFDPDPDGLAVFGRALPEQEPLSQAESWLPMRLVIESMARYPDYAAGTGESLFAAQRLYYGQSAALARFVIDQDDGLARVHNFVDGLRDGADSEDSFEAAFGLRYGPLEARVRGGLSDTNARLRVRRVAGRATAPITSRPIAPTDRATNAARLLLSYGRKTSAGAAVARNALAQPGVDLGQLDTARALHHWRRGEWDLSDLYGDRVLVRNPADPRALKIRAKTAYGRVSETQGDDTLWTAAEGAALQALAVSPDDAQLHLFRVAVSLPVEGRVPDAARASLDWLDARRVEQRLPHEAMMMIPALIYEGRLERADAVLDNAARWTTDTADRFVIERLRDNVAVERARLGR